MRVVGRLIGQGLVEEVAEFLILGGDMLRGFHVRSQRMQEFLSTADLGFAVVTSPETVPECLRLHAMLREMGFENEFFVANRVLAYADEGASGLRQLAHSPPGRAGRAPERPPLASRLEEKIDANHEGTRRLSRVHLDTLAGLMRKIGPGHTLYSIPQMAEDVFDLPALERLLESVAEIRIADVDRDDPSQVAPLARP
jgi:hypothetical protein